MKYKPCFDGCVCRTCKKHCERSHRYFICRFCDENVYVKTKAEERLIKSLIKNGLSTKAIPALNAVIKERKKK